MAAGCTGELPQHRPRPSGWPLRCEGANTPALSLAQDVERLSSREHEVALLAANGLTSRAIAERLYVSKRTVDNHLQRIYTKLGVTGRHQLATRLRDSGEISGP